MKILSKVERVEASFHGNSIMILGFSSSFKMLGCAISSKHGVFWGVM